MTSRSCSSPNDIYTYKPFIDGLRAIAILTVVAAHVGVPGATGGFVGVDIFFVISGYLIINQIIADIRSERYSFFAFEARRALRILPAFLLMMTACLVLGTFFILSEYKWFAESYFFAAIMQANHHFLSHQDYFELTAFEQPLLHTWSLAVEEQFYLIAPLTLFGLSTWTRNFKPAAVKRTWIIVTVGLTLATFTTCVIFTVGTRNFSFYLMPMRGWEFILGGAAPVFVLTVQRFPRWTINLLAIAGVAAVALAVGTFDADTIFPSYRAALPVLGATLIIVSGLAYPQNQVARVLATRVMVSIGLVSYPWYLWHWPLLSLFRIANFGVRNLILELGVGVLSLVLAVLTYRLVEVPVRNWRRSFTPRPVPVVLSGVAACLIVGVSGYGWAMYVAPHFLPALDGLDPIPVAGTANPPPSRHGVLMGDSHAFAIVGPLQDHARPMGSSVTLIGALGCPPLLNVAVEDHQGVRRTLCDERFGNLSLTGFEFAILTARWNYYAGLSPSDAYLGPAMPANAEGRDQASDPYALLDKGLTSMIDAAMQSGVRRILVIGPLPEFAAHPPDCLIRQLWFSIGLCTVSRDETNQRRAKTIETLRSVSSRFEGVRLIDPIDVFCTATTCRSFEGRTLFFHDTNHLSPGGIERMYRAFQSDFKWVLTGSESGIGARQ
jgi:peptidoglycan/LPS O-acetylase OafA/YrhL